MDVVERTLHEVEYETEKISHGVGKQRTIFSKWKLHVASKKDAIPAPEATSAGPDVDPEVMRMVDRALELVSRLKVQPEEPRARETGRPDRPQALPTGAGPRQTSPPKSSARPGAVRPPAPLPGAVRTPAPLSSAVRPPAPLSSAVRPPASRRPPVLAGPPTSSSRVRPVHMSAPFKTDSNLPASNYRRLPSARTPAGSGRRSRGASSTRPESSSSVARRWLRADIGWDGRARAGVRQDPDPTPAARPGSGDSTTKPSERQPAPVRGPPRAEVGVHAGAELRRSLSSESLSSPRAGPSCRTEEEESKFDFKSHIKHVPIPSKFRKELRLSHNLLNKLMVHMNEEVSPALLHFYQRLNEPETANKKILLRHYCSKAAEIEQRFQVFDQVIGYLDIERAAAEQVRWCWQWLLEALNEFMAFQNGYHLVLESYKERHSSPSSLTCPEKDPIEIYFESEKGRRDPAIALSANDVYDFVGGQRTCVYYGKKKELINYVDKVSYLFKMRKIFEVADGLKKSLGDLESIVRNAKNPATAYRQLSGLLVNKFPVMIYDDS